MLKALVEVSKKPSDIHYAKIDEFRKKIIIALLESGKGKVIWSKDDGAQSLRLRQIVTLDGKKYMVHFFKNKLVDIFLVEKKHGI